MNSHKSITGVIIWQVSRMQRFEKIRSHFSITFCYRVAFKKLRTDVVSPGGGFSLFP